MRQKVVSQLGDGLIMKGNKLEFKSADEAEAVYYESFRRCDVQVMAALWADGDVICVHPGSAAVVGYEAVVRSWQHILADARMPDFEVSVIKRTVTDQLAVHLVAEQLSSGDENAALVLATNVYQRLSGGWLMIEHHASLVEARLEGHTLQ